MQWRGQHLEHVFHALCSFWQEVQVSACGLYEGGSNIDVGAMEVVQQTLHSVVRQEGRMSVSHRRSDGESRSDVAMLEPLPG